MQCHAACIMQYNFDSNKSTVSIASPAEKCDVTSTTTLETCTVLDWLSLACHWSSSVEIGSLLGVRGLKLWRQPGTGTKSKCMKNSGQFVFPFNATGAFCATNSLHSWNHVKDLAAMCILKRISAMICLNTGLYSDCCGWIILIFMLVPHQRRQNLLWISLADMASSGLVLGHSLAHSALRYSGAAGQSDGQLDTSAVKKREVTHNLLSCTLYQNNWLLCPPLFLFVFTCHAPVHPCLALVGG